MAGVGSGSGRRAGVGSVRGSPYKTPLSACATRSAPTFHEAHGAPTTLTFNLPITGLVVVSASNHNVVTGAIAAQKYQELSLRLQKEYDQSPPKSLVNSPPLLESSMPKSKKHTDTSSSSSSGSHRDPTVPFRSIIDQSIRHEEMGLAQSM